MLTITMTGPMGDMAGDHQYSPGLSLPVGLPVGVPLVWNDGCGMDAASAGGDAAITPAIIAR